MIDTNRVEVDIKHIERLVRDYVKQNFSPNLTETAPAPSRRKMLLPIGLIGGLYKSNVDTFNFRALFKKNEEESFSQMLLRLIKESGKKNSTIYNRANIDRRHFSKIANHDDYQPGKQTVLAFTIALKLGFEETKALLASAGFTLSNASLSDVIVSAFIENKIFDIDLVNQILYKYDQPLLGS